MPQYHQPTMENSRANQPKLQDAWKPSVDPQAFARHAETNMAMFKAAASAFMPKGTTPAPERKPEPKPQSDLDTLRAQLAEMQRKLDELGK
jgi:polyhydroxyalkanoate synthesis regulator protein